MSMRTAVLSLAPLVLASQAWAQAPGETPIAPPPPASESPCAYGGNLIDEPVMANRWSVGLSVGHMTVSPDAMPDTKSEFGYGELLLGFRATPHLELALAVGGGRQQLDGDKQGDLEAHTAVFEVRYRFRPQHKWNWYLEAGLGGASITQHDASNDTQDKATQPLGMFGVGLERRWNHFALSAELRGIGMGERKDEAKATPVAVDVMGGVDPVSTQPSAEKKSGGTFTIGASYYF